MSGTAARGSECVLDLETEVKIARDRSAFQIRHVNLGCILLLVDSPYLAPLWAARASAAAARGTMRRSILGLVLLLLGLEWSAAVGDTGRKLLASGLLRGKSVGDDGGGVGGVADSTRHRSDTSDGLPPPNTIFVDPTKIQVVSDSSPRAYLYRGFLKHAECEYIIQNSQEWMAKSTVVDNKTGKSVPSTIRTSDGTFMARGADDVIADIERRISEWSHVPIDHGEGIQVLRYVDGQRYDAHMDAFSDSFNTDESKGGQRVATVLMYLSDVEEGGETVFLLTDSKPHLGDDNFSQCAQKGHAVHAKKGDALLFWSMDTSQKLDQKSTHAGCPVTKGVKWSATKWMHVGAFSQGHKMVFPEGVCDDENDGCKVWAQQGECEKNPNFMVGPPHEDGHCMRSCGKCPDGSRTKDQ